MLLLHRFREEKGTVVFKTYKFADPTPSDCWCSCPKVVSNFYIYTVTTSG